MRIRCHFLLLALTVGWVFKRYKKASLSQTWTSTKVLHFSIVFHSNMEQKVGTSQRWNHETGKVYFWELCCEKFKWQVLFALGGGLAAAYGSEERVCIVIANQIDHIDDIS